MHNKKTRMSKEDRRKQITTSALKTFTIKGYNGTTTIDIANDAGISEVTLFRYFDSKEEIFKSAIEPLLVSEFKKSIISIKDMNSYDKLKFILKDRIQFITNNNEVIKLILIEYQFNPDITNINYIKEIKLMIEDSIKESNVLINDKDFFMRILMGNILSFLYDPVFDENEINQHVDKFVDSLMKTNFILEKDSINE